MHRASPFGDTLVRFINGLHTVLAYTAGWKRQSAGAAVAVDSVQSSGLVFASFRVLCLEELLMGLCLTKRLGQSPTGFVNNVWTVWCSTVRDLLNAGCAIYIGFTGQRHREKGLGCDTTPDGALS